MASTWLRFLISSHGRMLVKDIIESSTKDQAELYQQILDMNK